MSKVVLDTNIFIAAILSSTGGCRSILRHALEGRIHPLMGEALFYEHKAVLSRKALFTNCPISSQEREELFNAFLAACQWIKVYYLWRPNLRDESDNHLIELAVAGGAGVVVTQNVRDLKSGELYFEHLRILSPEEFLQERLWE